MMDTRIGLTTETSHNMCYAPLAVLGYCLTKADYFAALREVVRVPIRTRHYAPYDKLLDCLISMWAGCTSLHQINVHLRPDRVLAQAWGRGQFAEQSTISDTLDAFTPENISQLHDVNSGLLKQHGQTPRHDWAAGELEVDIDLSHLPASASAEGSHKGYGAGKKMAPDASWYA